MIFLLTFYQTIQIGGLLPWIVIGCLWLSHMEGHHFLPMWFPSFLWLMAEGAPFNLFRCPVKCGPVNDGWIKSSAQILCVLKHPFYAIMAHRKPSLFGSRLQGIPTEVGFENRMEHLSLLLIDYGLSVPNLISKWYRLHLLHPLFQPQSTAEAKLYLFCA